MADFIINQIGKTNTYGKTQSIKESRESVLYLIFNINNCIIFCSSSRKEKEKQVIKLAEEGKTTREIAKEVHISLKDIGKIIRKETGDIDDHTEREKEKEKEKEKQKRLKSLSPYAQAFQMFKNKLSLADVVIELDIDTGYRVKLL